MCVAQHIRRDAFGQPVLHLAHVAAGGEAGAVGEAEDVGIDRHRTLAERDVEHDIGGLAADAGQRLQRFTIMRHRAAVLFKQLLGERIHIARLALP